MSFVIYDLETTGTNRHFDQILQLAAIKTDDQLEHEEIFETNCRLLPFVIPAPGALATNGLSVAEITSESRQSHFEMMCAVKKQLAAWCPTMFLGFNSIRFDEEFLRHAFYQCLLYPYLTNTRPSARADVLALARAFASFHPDQLTIPIGDDGRPKFNLRALSTANGFPDFRAHEALADVRATLHICQLVRRCAPDLWSRFLRFAQKDTAISFLTDEAAVLVFEATSRRASYWVTRIGNNRNKKQSHIHYCLNLDTDIDQLRAMGTEELQEALTLDRNIVRKVKVNASPMLCPIYEAPAHMLGNRDESEWEERAQLVQGDRAFLDRLLSSCEIAEPVYPPALHVEQQLYGDDFWPRTDDSLMAEFHAASWDDRRSIVSRFTDKRLKQLSQRLLFLERPHLLPDPVRQRLAAAMQERMSGAPESAWMTISKARYELRLHPDCEGLAGYEEYLDAMN